MLRGLWRLTWLEIKIFVREPLGLFGTVGMPVIMFIVFGRMLGLRNGPPPADVPVIRDLPVLVALIISINVVLSLVAILSIYREGGILKRLRATPLRPQTILTAHVLVKLLFTAVTVALMMLAGRRYYPAADGVPLGSFTVALLFSTVCLLSLGFLIASIVPTARFAQPIGGVILYPMLAFSGLFFPLEPFPPVVRMITGLLPFTYATSLLKGIWRHESWLAHGGDLAVLAAMTVAFTLLSARVFRWE